MVDQLYSLYKVCLPDVVRNADIVKAILSAHDNHIIYHTENGKPVGVSVINKNTIYLLCVRNEHRGKGIGSDLLKKSEAHIKKSGYDKIVIGAGKDYITPGIPMSDNAHVFFMKHGYIHSWEGEKCIDMDRDMNTFACTGINVGDVINGTIYRWANCNDIKQVVSFISSSYESFTEHYQNPELYNQSNQNTVLIAELDKEITGAIIVSVDIDDSLGSLGALSTAEKHRKKGIATNLLNLGTKFLKDIGVRRVHLSYTYCALIPMYSRAGYKICQEYYMGEKTL